MATILALHGSPRVRDRIRWAVRIEERAGARHELFWLPSWGALQVRAQASPTGVAIVDPYHSGSFAEMALRSLLGGFPSLAVIAYGEFGGQRVRDLLELGRLGVADVVVAGGEDDPRALRRALLRATNAGAVAALLAPLRERGPPEAVALVELAVAHGLRPLSVARLAALAGDHRRSLHRRLRRAGLPDPRRLIAWTRLLHAARLMEDPGRSVNNVARSLGFSSESALRRSMRRHADLRPLEVLERGGAAHLAALFLSRLPAPHRKPA